MALFSLFGSRNKIKKRGKVNSDPLFSTSTQAFIARRITDIYGVILVSIGIFLVTALYSYSTKDPSFNTSTTNEEISNLMGVKGAYISDIMLQTLGLASYLFAIAFLVWGYRVLVRREFKNIVFKFTLLSIASLFASIIFARVPAVDGWDIGSYMGGYAGAIILNKLGNLTKSLFGQNSFTFTAIIAFMAALPIYLISLGISLEGWKRGLLNAKAFIHAAIITLLHIISEFKIWHTDHSNYKYKFDKDTHKLTKTEEKSEEEIVEKKSIIESIKERKKPIVEQNRKIVEKTKETRQKELALHSNDESIVMPSIDFLDDFVLKSPYKLDEDALQKNAELLQATLSDFGVKGEIIKISPGPVITLYEMEPAPGTKTSRVINLADDIARSMSATSVRVSVVPGRNAIGLELPNINRETVYLKEIIASEVYDKSKASLPLALGKDIAGNTIVTDLAKMPHLLVAGTTGSGKSVAVNTMILSLIYKLTPEQCRFIMIDPKMLELSVYDDIPHLLTPVVTEPHKAISALKWAVREMEDRYRAMSKLGVRNVESFNERIKRARDKGEVIMHKVQTGFDMDTGKPIYEEQAIPNVELPYIVVIVDEFADLMLVAGKEVEKAIQRLAQMARAAGIHLIMATQRPSVDVITGIIKANFPTRISFQVTSKIDSRTIIGDGGAEQLLGKGDMLYMAAGGKVKRIHGPFVSDDEIEKVVKHLKSQGTPDYIDGVTTEDEGDDMFGEGGDSSDGGRNGYDELYDQAVAIIIREGKVSTSFIQRHLQIGYNRAARIVECMEREGLITPANSNGKRDILVEHGKG